MPPSRGAAPPPLPPRQAPGAGGAVDDPNILVFVRVRPELDPVHRAVSALSSGLAPLQVDPETGRVTIRTPPRASSVAAPQVDAKEAAASASDAGTEEERGATVGAGGSRSWHTFAYDGVFAGETGNEEVFRACAAPLVKRLLAGNNTTVFAYGQTGSGKTHTMTGTATDPGVALRLMSAIFDAIDDMPDTHRVVMSISSVEVLGKRVFDLLDVNADGSRKELVVHALAPHVVKPNTPFIDGLSAAQQFYAVACERRAVGSTAMNAASSRTHMLTRLNLEVRTGGASPRIYVSTLTLVDLAGSEDVRRSNASGVLFDQACGINSDLAALRRVAHSLSAKAKHVPYHDSTLTRLLRPTLGGNARAVMIGTVSSGVLDAHDTLSTLRVAADMRNVKNHVIVNAFDSIESLRAENADLRRRLAGLVCGVCEARSHLIVRAVSVQTDDAPTGAASAAAAAAAAAAARPPPSPPRALSPPPSEPPPQVPANELPAGETPGRPIPFGLSVEEASDLYAQLDEVLEENVQLQDHLRATEAALREANEQLKAREAASVEADGPPSLRVAASAQEAARAASGARQIPVASAMRALQKGTLRPRVEVDALEDMGNYTNATKGAAPMPVERGTDEEFEVPVYTEGDGTEEEEEDGDEDEKEPPEREVRSFVDPVEDVPSRAGARGLITLPPAAVPPPVPPPPPPPLPPLPPVPEEPAVVAAETGAEARAAMAELEVARTRCEELSRALEAAQAERANTASRVKAMEAEVARVTDAMRWEAAQRQARIDALTRQLEESRSAEVAATLRASAAASDTASARDRARALEAQAAESQVRLDDQLRKVALLGIDNSALSTKAVDLATRLRKAEREVETLERERGAFAVEAKRARDSVVTERTVTSQTLATVRSQLEAERLRNAALDTENGRLRVLAAKLEGDARGLIAAGARQERELAEARDALAYLQDLARRSARAATVVNGTVRAGVGAPPARPQPEGDEAV